MTKATLAATLLCLGMSPFEVSTVVLAQADKYQVTPQEKAACQDDAVVLCGDAYPDEDKLIACMRQNKAQLSSGCFAVFEAGMKRRHMAL